MGGGRRPAQEAGIRTAFARTGLVVAREGGAWGRMFPIFRAGVGGRLGNGRQYWSYISLRDEVAALRHVIDTPGVSGPVNLTAPEPLTNRQVTEAMARVLHRPALLPVPAVALRVVLGSSPGTCWAVSGPGPRGCWSPDSSFATPASSRRSAPRSEIRVRPPCDRS